MKDFRLAGFSYLDSCKIAAKCDVVPLKEPDDETIKKMKTAVDSVFSRISLEDYDFPVSLVGLFIYDSITQDGCAKDSLGITLYNADDETEATEAVIGLSTECLSITSKAYQVSSLLHELAHLAADGSDAGGHGDKFEENFNQLEYDYYCQPVREDAKFLKLHNTLRNWKR